MANILMPHRVGDSILLVSVQNGIRYLDNHNSLTKDGREARVFTSFCNASAVTNKKDKVCLKYL